MFWKKTLLTASALAVLLIGFGTADAHTRVGTWTIQGSVAMASSTGDLYGNDAMTQFSMSPGVQYFVIDKLALGIKAPVQFFEHGNRSNTSLLIGPTASYYFGDVDARANPYLGAGVFVRSIDTEVGNVNITESGSSIGATAGIALFLRDYLALSPELSVNFESIEGQPGTTVMAGMSLAGFLY